MGQHCVPQRGWVWSAVGARSCQQLPLMALCWRCLSPALALRLSCAFTLAPVFQAAEHLVVMEHEVACINCLEMVNNGHLDQPEAALHLQVMVMYLQVIYLQAAIR